MILSPSGGLVYHARAAFWFSRWEETRRSVSTAVSLWLSETRPERLIVFGPSGGYLLSDSVFSSAALATPIELVVVDPDPVAKLVFKKRFGANPISWYSRSDFLPFMSLDPHAFLKLVDQQKSERRVAVLFLGLFGQMGLHQKEFKRPKGEASKILLESLKSLNVPWASLHDLESKFLLSRLTTKADKEIFDAASSLGGLPQASRIQTVNELLQATDPKASQDSPWIDHETEWLGSPRTVIPWMLSRRRVHILGWCER